MNETKATRSWVQSLGPLATEHCRVAVVGVGETLDCIEIWNDFEDGRSVGALAFARADGLTTTDVLRVLDAVGWRAANA